MKLTTGAWVLPLLALLTCSTEAAADKPMNVLLLIVNDLNTWQLGDTDRYAGKVVSPNIKKLADSGVTFRWA